MSRSMLLALALAASAACAQTSRYAAAPAVAEPTGAPQAEWAMNASLIEACSCPMFCQCFFNTEPAAHPGCCPPGTDPEDVPRYCRFNIGFRVNEGHHGETRLDGAKFWVAGDLGSGWEDGTTDWAILHFDPAVTEPQREGIVVALGATYGLEWQSFEVGEDLPIEWRADGDRAVAKLDGGDAAEVVLVRFQGMSDDPIVIQNLRYWNAPRNEGFVLMPNEVEAYHLGDKAYEHRGTTGFMITYDINSEDPPPEGAY